MAQKWSVIGVACACLVGACTTAPSSLAEEPAGTGQLIIAGGGLSQDTAPVWHAFKEAAKESGSFVIVPSASGQPAQSANAVRETLIKYGITAERIAIAELALLDDPSTPAVNEAWWRKNAASPDVAGILESAAAIWFTGGDQSRTTRLLFEASGEDTRALAAIRRAHKGGAPIGGTSAGAAVMSDPMITQGDTLSALLNEGSGEALGLGTGLGFFERGLVDQHFGERARLGRLAAALMQLEKPEDRIGFGIDEDTAIVTKPDGQFTIAGNGYVTLLDARGADLKTLDSGALQITGLTLHLVSAGDTISADTLALTPAEWKRATLDNEYVEAPTLGGGGMALSGQSLPDVIGEGLIDNRASTSVERISFDNEGRGVAYMFTQLPQSEGFWGRGPDGAGRYAIANIRFDILPVRLTIETLQ